MLSRTLILAAALAALAGCDKANDPSPSHDRSSSAPSESSGGAPSSAAGASRTPTTPANLPSPSTAEKREGANPVQGQVDPKESAQHRDFQQKGDSAGPKGPDTAPSK